MLTDYIKDLGRQEGSTLVLSHLVAKNYQINPDQEHLSSKLQLLTS